MQFALDANTNALVTLANNEGTLNTVAPITVGGEVFDFTENGGLDILSEFEGDNLAVALLSGGGNTGLYTIDLSSGAASLFGEQIDGQLVSFAAQTDATVAPIPVPATIPLLLTGLGAIGALQARRRKSS